MKTDLQTPEILVKDIPELSQKAWQEMLLDLPASEPLDGQNPTLGGWQNLRLAKLPGWEKLSVLPDDSWVFCYEQIQEMLARRLRKMGEPQNGVFYTPPAVANYLIERTLGAFLQESSKKIRMALQSKNLSSAVQAWQAVQAVRMIDPACGTGVFLVAALKRLHRFYQEMSALAPQFKLENPAHAIIKLHLAGIDLDPLSVMITEFRLAQLAVHLDGHLKPLDSENLTFWVGDTLQQSIFPGFKNVGAITSLSAERPQWQFVLGNPPYLTEVRGQAQRFRPLQQRSGYYQSKMDLCDGFLAWALDHVSPGGQIAYVLPAYWAQRSSTASLREKLWAEGQLQEIWHFAKGRLFKNAPGHHTALVIWQKQAEKLVQSDSPELAVSVQTGPVPSIFQTIHFGKGETETDLDQRNLKTYSALWQDGNGKILVAEPSEIELLARLSELPPLLAADEIQQGLVIPQGRLRAVDWARLAKSEHADLMGELQAEAGVFVLNEQEQAALQLTDEERAVLRPYYRPAGFQAFQGFQQTEPQERIIYTDLHHRRLLESNPESFARLRRHLDRFSAVNTSAFAPYGLHRARQPAWFEDERKILVPRQIASPAFAVVPFPAYVNEGFLSIRSGQDPHWLCAVLNSHLAWFWFYHQKRKGDRLQLDKEVLCQFPQPSAASAEIRQVGQVLANKLSLPGQSQPNRLAWQRELNALMAQAYELTLLQINSVGRLVAELSASFSRKRKA